MTADKDMEAQSIHIGEMTLTNGDKAKNISVAEAKVSDKVFEEEGDYWWF